jgi:hypothetical protein
MASREKYTHRIGAQFQTYPFDSAQEAWFWFIQAQEARNDGARFTAGASILPRPCEPMDILKVVDRLYRHRRLVRDHLLVLRHYGRRHLAPDPRRAKEARSHTLWTEGLDRIGSVLESKGIVQKTAWIPKSQNWTPPSFNMERQV